MLKLVIAGDDQAPKTGEILGIPAQEIADTVSLVCASGCALMISSTSDGGAVSVTLYIDSERHRAYAASSGSFSGILAAVRDICEARMVRGPMKPPKLPHRRT